MLCELHSHSRLDVQARCILLTLAVLDVSWCKRVSMLNLCAFHDIAWRAGLVAVMCGAIALETVNKNLVAVTSGHKAAFVQLMSWTL